MDYDTWLKYLEDDKNKKWFLYRTQINNCIEKWFELDHLYH
jgi:hypothetical protein